MKYLISFVLFFSATLAYAETYCEKTQRYHKTIGIWDRKCGPNPDKDPVQEAKLDCFETTKAIAQRPGARWMFEDQCERLELGYSE